MLKVWLPLTENTNNQGISSLNTFSYNNLTQQTDGKIGKCYSGQAIYHLNEEILNNTWSLCAWVKSAAWSQYNDIILCKNTTASDNCQFYFSIINGAQLNFAVNAGSGGLTFNYTFATNTWYHVAATYDGAEYALYINGEQKKKQAVSVAAKTGMNNLGINCRSTNAAGTAYTGDSGKKLNDVRIYDHCLSTAEVREISKGLVLHYKLDGNLFGNPNLYTGSEKFTGTWVNSANWTTSTETYQNFVVKQKSTTWGGLAQNITCTQNDIFTISFYGKVESGGNIQSVHRSNLGNTTSGLSILNGNFSSGTLWVQTTEDGTQWKRYWATVQIASSDITYLQWRIENSIADKNFYICGLKLEKGSVATPWCLADSEMTIDRTIIEDSSGYGYHLTSNSILSVDTNTPRYSTATLFDGTQVATRTTPGADIRTISCWVKTTKNKSTSQIFVADSGSNMCVSFYSGTIIGVFGTTRSTGSKCTLGDSYKENDWNHIVVVKTSDDGKRDIWCNGVQLTAAANDYWSAAAGTWLGARNSSIDNPLYGALSDVRFYCTPLLDTDIKQLYNVGMKVDKSQNIHTFEINEKNINIFSSTPWTNNFNNHSPNTNPFTNYNSNNEPQFTTNSSSAGSDYIVITPGIYEWDYTVSINAGNQFYIGFERYDADKTSRSNAATVYQLGFKPSEDLIKKRFFGTVDLSTDGVNPIKYIALRILNGWSGTTSGVTGQATVHNFSLRLKSAAQNPKIIKVGQLIGDEFKEYTKASFYKDHIIEANQFIER